MTTFDFNKGNNATARYNSAVEFLRTSSHPMNNENDLDALINLIGDAHYVLLGEASHGTHEYYTWRTRITKRLVEEKQFSFIAVEGDWPDCYRVNRYVKGYANSGGNAKEVLQEFNRWPTWMWGNWETVALAEWLRKHNDKCAAEKKVGFYGLDVYSLFESIDEIMAYLKKQDPETFCAAEKVMECFKAFGEEEGKDYARSISHLPVSCANEVVHLLSEIRKKMSAYNSDHEAAFNAEQNALVAVNAERYYRTMIKGGPASWNVRDRHMAHTLDRLMHFHGANAKTIVWEHNTHVGDARATNMSEHGMVNIGQILCEEQGEDDVMRVGFGSYKGATIAGKYWGDEMKEMQLPAAVDGTWENLLHEAGGGNKLILSNELEKQNYFFQPIPHRAVGVVYDPENKQGGTYVPSIMPVRYEAFIYLDETTALHPLRIKPHGNQIPETFPWGV